MHSFPIYDAHNHLQDARLFAHLEGVIREVKALRVRKMVVNGAREEDWDAVLTLASKHDWIIPSIGLHPWHVSARTPKWNERFQELVIERDCAIGEIGLDRWMPNYDSTAQEAAFVAQLEFAATQDRAVSIHCLKAWGRLLEILKSELRPARGFLLHSYGGPLEMVAPFADLGAYFSLSGYFAHERKGRQGEVFRHVPRDRLLLETDAPDMTPPEAIRRYHIPGDLNHPANIAAVYEFASELLKTEIETLAGQIENNFRRLFGG